MLALRFIVAAHLAVIASGTTIFATLGEYSQLKQRVWRLDEQHNGSYAIERLKYDTSTLTRPQGITVDSEFLYIANWDPLFKGSGVVD